MVDDLHLGVEIGATKQQAALGDASGTLHHLIAEKIPLPDGARDIHRWPKATMNTKRLQDIFAPNTVLVTWKQR